MIQTRFATSPTEMVGRYMSSPRGLDDWVGCSRVSVEATTLVAKELNDGIHVLLRNGILFEHTFERVFEALRGETVEHGINPTRELLEVATMEMGRNPLDVRTSSKHHQIAGIRHATAMEFHREE